MKMKNKNKELKNKIVNIDLITFYSQEQNINQFFN